MEVLLGGMQRDGRMMTKKQIQDECMSIVTVSKQQLRAHETG